MAVSWVMLALNREPPSTEVKPSIPITRYFRQLPAVLRTNANYRRYVISRGVILFGTMAGSFYIIYGREELGVTMTEIGYFTLLLTISTFAMNLIWGLLADRIGHKAILCIAGAILALTAASALFAPSQAWLALTFVLLGAYVAADTVSSLNIILEFCAPADRPTYIGLTNTLLAPLFAFAPIVGGLVATAFGFSTLFGLALISALIGTIMLTIWVREPRRVPISESSGA
jgi:MFS family permease